MKRSAAYLFAGCICFFPFMGVAQDAALYTSSQAQQGEALYASQCAACHGAQLEGTVGPALTGTSFHQMAAVQHLTPQSLLDVVTKTMPMTAPGTLKPDQYAAIVAFILQRSGYPAGTTALSKDSANLAGLDLGIDKSASSSGAAPAAAASASSAMRPASSGVYTGAQAARGKVFWADNCAQCHGGDVDGGEGGPPLTGPSFMRRWGALPVGAVHAFIDKQMPPGNAGALGAVQESDIVAFVLSKNGFPPGATALPSDPAGLNGIGWK